MTARVTNGRCVSGRSSAAVADVVRASILKAEFPFGAFLPSARELAKEHSVDMKTALRAMKVLEAEGLVRAVRGQGFRVLARAGGVAQGAPIGYIGPNSPERQFGTGTTIMLSHALQQAAARRGWCMMSVPDDLPIAQMLETLRGYKVLGAVINSVDDELVAGLAREGLPLVMVDSNINNPDVDRVMQDGHAGSRLAVEFLLERGRSRIAWLGNRDGGAHLSDRLGGAVARLHQAGRELTPGMINAVPIDRIEGVVRGLLSRQERPDAIVALWTKYMLAAAEACRSLGLKVGRDVDVVGWSNQEMLEQDLSGSPSSELVSAVVTWSARDMAETALARLIQRRESPDLPPVLIKVPARLVTDCSNPGRAGR